MQIQGVTDTIELRLREEIMTGKIAPGDRVNELNIAERYGVSRPPLREALRKLENENLVVSIPRRGSYVTKLSRLDSLQIYKARIMIECSAIDIIKEQNTHDLEPLQLVLAEERDLSRRIEEDIKIDHHEKFLVMSKFHMTLVQMCGNNWLTHFYKQLRPTMGRYQIIYLMISDEPCHAGEEHDMVFELLRDQKYDAAKNAVRAHIERTLNVLQDKIPE